MAHPKFTFASIFFLILTTSFVLADTTCYTNVATIPANCTGGIITRDDYNRQGDSCRYILCSSVNNSVDSISVKACDKPGSTNAQYFEMYRQSAAGVVPQVCIDG